MKPKSHLDPTRTTPLGMLRHAVEFHAAAIAADNALGDEEGYEKVAPIPVNYLIGRAIELALKAYLLQCGLSLQQTKALGHDLVACYGEAVNHGLRSSQGDKDTLTIVSALYADKQFEYIETGLKTFPVFGPLQILSETLIYAAVDKIPDGEVQLFRKAGRYMRPRQ